MAVRKTLSPSFFLYCQPPTTPHERPQCLASRLLFGCLSPLSFRLLFLWLCLFQRLPSASFKMHRLLPPSPEAMR